MEEKNTRHGSFGSWVGKRFGSLILTTAHHQNAYFEEVESIYLSINHLALAFNVEGQCSIYLIVLC
jgi:hypothetical protein